MARIRTIKPEFPQSESMGNVSRDARLLFIMLWTICDDSGRSRAASRMLASLLFPYDDGEEGHQKTSASDVDRWLTELEHEGCLVRYEADGSHYLQICNWLNHQKIDKPSASKIPPFDERSRILANPRERSSGDLDQGPRTKEGIKELQPAAVEDSAPSAPSPPSTDDRICDAVVAAYHEALPRCRHVGVLNPKRRRRILAADKLARKVCMQQGWQWDRPWFWSSYFDECTKDPWMRGEVPNPNNPRWQQNLDVLIAEDRFASIMDEVISAELKQEAQA